MRPDFRKFVAWQIAEGSHGLVPVGTTGKSATLTHDEHKRVVELCVEEANGKVPVIAGAGSNSTAEAIELTEFAKSVGADAVLSVAPYYNKPSQEGIYRHFAAIAEAVDIPILLYNIPGRSIVEISVETMARLSKVANIIGVKDATSNMARPSRERLVCGPDWRHDLGRGCDHARLHGPWRPWLHLGHGQCGAEAVFAVPGGLHGGRLRQGARAAGQADRPA